MLPSERVSLTLTTLCGAIPLDNFLANDYDDSIELDYREFEQDAVAARSSKHKDDSAYRTGVVRSRASSFSDGSDMSHIDDAAVQALIAMDIDEDRQDDEAKGERAGTGEGPSRDSLGVSPVGEATIGNTAEILSGPETASLASSQLAVVGLPSPESLDLLREAALEKLYKACTRLSGTAEALHFEYIEEDPAGIKCILTVTIPTHDGTSRRSYSTSPEFVKRSDAKGDAARIAVDMGVIDFLKSATSSAAAAGSQAELIAQANEAQDGSKEQREAGQRAMRQIAQLCAEWRVGVAPEYVVYRQKKSKENIGCAIRIALTPNALRIYSTNPDYNSPERAREACALLATEDGVEEYIMYGNGQKTKPQESEEPIPPAKPVATRPLFKQMSLQDYFDSLPRPFSEAIDESKGASEIPWSSMMNIIIQGAKLRTVKAMFHPIDMEYKTGLTGCVLRIVLSDPLVLSVINDLEGTDRKEIVKTYIVNPHFVKTNDAKNAACILAVTRDLRSFLMDISKKYEDNSRGTRDFERKAFEVAMRTIARFRGTNIVFEATGGVSSGNTNSFACSLSIDVGPEDRPERRTYTTPAKHGSKADAKVAVVLDAAQRGLIELLRYHRAGKEPPDGYRTFWDVISKGEAYDMGSLASEREVNEEVEKIKAEKRRLKRKRTAEKKKAAAKVPQIGGIAVPITSETMDQDGESGEDGEISEDESVDVVVYQAVAPHPSTCKTPEKERDWKRRKWPGGKGNGAAGRGVNRHGGRGANGHWQHGKQYDHGSSNRPPGVPAGLHVYPNVVPPHPPLHLPPANYSSTHPYPTPSPVSPSPIAYPHSHYPPNPLPPHPLHSPSLYPYAEPYPYPPPPSHPSPHSPSHPSPSVYVYPYPPPHYGPPAYNHPPPPTAGPEHYSYQPPSYAHPTYHHATSPPGHDHPYDDPYPPPQSIPRYDHTTPQAMYPPTYPPVHSSAPIIQEPRVPRHHHDKSKQNQREAHPRGRGGGQQGSWRGRR
ncbi:hypothetical protein DFP72DRAFT_893610 [Ephemerocybe angulata]|uniref:Uncharacterized protein n=1 Tax=Ephemerocybe angulata TaxID=980116 RepID=A0A8H6I164_9AGAR|nr:hypothetical protein DFP72DRAFT_893610 [Tulosesus angulatus]